MATPNNPKVGKTFNLVLIKPTHYDDDGYPIQWRKTAFPSNTLAVLNGLADDCIKKQVLGSDVNIKLLAIDETNTDIPIQSIIRNIANDGGSALVGLVGVQTNQFPRALDISRFFAEADIPVCIGGFHVSGCLSMLPSLPPELERALSMGISLFAGEAEDGRFGELLKDAHYGVLKPIYNYTGNLPDLENAPIPALSPKHLGRTFDAHSSIDLGRGCPFQCSFCTIINVQGRKSRSRSADDLERMVRVNYEQGFDAFFVTDDNFARNKDWEILFDRLISIKELEGICVRLFIQVDTQCHKIENFIEKAAKAGVVSAFVGLENVNPDNLLAAKKGQNKIFEYRQMLQKWKEFGITTYAGYIVGFPNDTFESFSKDIDIIQNELAIDIVGFNILTPLPGSADHKAMYLAGDWMDPDLNKYDLNHLVTHHQSMGPDDFKTAYEKAWDSYYSLEHIERVLRRAFATNSRPKNTAFMMVWYYLNFKLEKVHPVDGGYFRKRSRMARRPELPIEGRLVFYSRYLCEIVSKHLRILPLATQVALIYWRIMRDPARMEYRDSALDSSDSSNLEDLALFNETRGGAKAVADYQHNSKIIASAKKAARKKLA